MIRQVDISPTMIILVAVLVAASSIRTATGFCSPPPLYVVARGQQFKASCPPDTSRNLKALAVASQECITEFRSRHWMDQDFIKEGGIAQRLESKLALEDDHVGSTTTPLVSCVHCNKDDKVICVQVESALSEHEAAAVQALAGCIRDDDLSSTLFSHRSFGEEKGGNDCTYLAPVIQAVLPQLAKRVVDICTLAYETAEWESAGHPHPRLMGIRTSEHLSYNGWKSLEPHKDAGSMYTTMIALAEDYDGGEFFIHNSFFDHTDITPKRLSATVFLSETTHGVRPITSGHRESFVTELWQYDDAPLGMNRPTPEEWQVFLKKDAKEKNV